MGKIIELMTSYDEQVRAAKIQLASKRVISRPLNLLYPIECTNETEQSHGPTYDKDLILATDETLRQRPKREAAQKALKQIRKQID